MKVGVAGVQELVRTRHISTATFPDGNGGVMGFATPAMLWDEGPLTDDEIVQLLTKHKLTVNHTLSKAADRGTAVHDALEFWAGSQEVPTPSLYPPEQKGYVEALNKFLKDLAPAEPEVVASELMVGSVEHGFAGRYDIRVRTHKPCYVVFHRTPVKGPQIRTLEPGLHTWDLKTSKGVYLSHHKQLAGYEIGTVECGYEPSDELAVIHVSADGNYELVRSVAKAEDFLTTLAEWKSQKEMGISR
jgi:hypothetical protein